LVIRINRLEGKTKTNLRNAQRQACLS
jgi:hypothetical protein